MKNLKITLIIAAIVSVTALFGESPTKYTSTKTHAKFFSTTPIEDIEANAAGSLKSKVKELYASIQGFFKDHHRFQFQAARRKRTPGR